MSPQYEDKQEFPQKRIVVLQKKALRIMSFVTFNSQSLSYFHICSILKFCDIINTEVCALINNCFNSNTFSAFAERFKLVSESHAHNTNLFCYSNMEPLTK